MVQQIIRCLNIFLLWIKKGRTVKLTNGTVKVNIGSGLSVAPGWINVDGNINAFFSNFPLPLLRIIYRSSGAKNWFEEEFFCNTLKNNTFIHHKIEYGLPFPDESVDFVYSSHLLEHLFQEDAKKLLSEIHRVLKKGGKVRICIPDLDYVFDLFRKGEKEKALAYLFPSSQADYLSRHRYMYDFPMISELLEKTGFTSIQKFNFKEGTIPDVENLDNRPEETLHVEATK